MEKRLVGYDIPRVRPLWGLGDAWGPGFPGVHHGISREYGLDSRGWGGFHNLDDLLARDSPPRQATLKRGPFIP